MNVFIGSYSGAPPASFSQFGVYQVPILDGTLAVGGMSFTALGTPEPLLYTSVSVPVSFGANVNGTLTYGLSIDVVGPPDLPSVPVAVVAYVNATAYGGATENGSLFARASWLLQDTLGGAILLSEGVTVNENSVFPETINHAVPLTLFTNHAYRISMSAQAVATGGYFGTGATAFIDPVFSFAPGTDPSYSFHLSDGIGNTPASAPEPGSVFLLASSVLAICFLRRPRRAER